MIVQHLHEIQHRCGYLPENELRALSARTGTRLYRLQEVASFFPHFRLKQPPRVTVRICRDMSCHLRGACELLEKTQRAASKRSDDRLVVEGASCLGRCDRPPVAMISNVDHGDHEQVYTDLDKEKLANVIKAAIKKNDDQPLADGDSDKNWQPDQHKVWEIDPYTGKPESQRYAVVRQMVQQTRGLDLELGDMEEPPENDIPQEVLDQLADPDNLGPPILQEPDPERKRIFAALFTGGLLGMGGAGGRAYKKWFDVRKAKGDQKYVVCNGDESEPGTFKDREILLRAPHLVVEGVIVAGLVLNATRGYIYIRHEFQEQIAAVRQEVARAERLGVCGEHVLGTDRNFPVEVFVSPGGYICGEQTALIQALEDKRAEPRNRPPELQTNGLWDRPTLLNNVETLAWVPSIALRDEGKWFSAAGRAKYQGRRFYSISGDVARPGAYEVPNGITLRELINDHAGGMRDGTELKAVALSGPSGGFLPRMLPVEYLTEGFVNATLDAGATHFDMLDMELDINASRKMGVMMGAGMVMFGETADMVSAALACTEFYRNESCGKCVPCRIGSQKLVELMTKIADRQFTLEEIYGNGNGASGLRGLVRDLADTMRLTTICGLGFVAPSPFSSLLDHFRDDVEAYVKNGKS